MKVGELFLDIGIKGSDKTVNSLGSVESGLKDVKTMSLEAKAAILAAVYALDQMMNQSRTTGQGLFNFGMETGGNIRQLQQWEYAMVKAGGTADEMESSIRGIQKAMASMDWGHGMPAGLGNLSAAIGGFDITKHNDPFYMADVIGRGMRAFATMGPKGKNMANELAATMGVSQGFMRGSYMGIFNPKTFAEAPIRSRTTVDALMGANSAINVAKYKMGMLFDNFTIKHGKELADNLLKISTSLVKLLDALDDLARATGAFQLLIGFINMITDSLKGLGLIINENDGVKKSKKSQLPPGLVPPSYTGLNRTDFGGKTIFQTIYQNLSGTFSGEKDSVAKIHKVAAEQAHKGMQKNINHAHSSKPLAGQGG
jgi:hypothetical protein